MKSLLTDRKQTASFSIAGLMLAIAPLWLMLYAALSILFLMSASTALVAQQQTSSEADSVAVLNSPSTESAGSDSILTFDSLGHSSVFFSASLNFQGLDDIACSLTGPPRLVVSHNDFSENVSELMELNASGNIVRRIPFGTPGGGGIALAYDDAGNFYAAQDPVVFKNGVLFTNLLPGGSEIGKMVADSRGRLYVTQPGTSQVVRVDALGNVTVFADSTQGMNTPYGVAVDGKDNIYVANNPPSAPAFILKFDPSGVPSSFAADISSQPDIRGMAFDLERDGDLYAAIGDDNEILKFDTTGLSSIFADASDGLDFPVSIARCLQFSVGADLFLRIRPTPEPVHQGDLLTYAFPVWNLGPSNAVHEVLTTQVPEGTTLDYVRISGTPGLGTCTTPPYEGTGEIVCHENSAMAPNTTWTVRVVVKVTAPAGTVITESATTTEETPDPNLANNTATVSLTVQ